MELLIIKSKTDYIRVKPDHYTICNLDKASVFPLEKLDIVKQHIKQLKVDGHPSAEIRKLILNEVPFKEDR